MSGCDADHYKPLNINGWFWASTLVKVRYRDFSGNDDYDREDGEDEFDNEAARIRHSVAFFPNHKLIQI